MGKTNQVLVFRASLLNGLGRFQGWSRESEKYLYAILDQPGNVSFLERSKAEEDENYKQLIPYVVMAFGQRIFAYDRSKTTDEARLQGQTSIGIGGHIETIDAPRGLTDRDFYFNAVKREVLEEVTVASPVRFDKVVGIINDDSNAVGRVHFGVVHLWSLSAMDVTPKETVIENPRFLSLPEFDVIQERLESWSRIALSLVSESL